MSIYNENQIKLIQHSCNILHDVMEHLKTIIHEGVATIDIDTVAEKMIRDAGAVPAFKGVKGDPDYPATCCISLNDEIVHGIPGLRKIKNGDIVSIDCGAKYKGYYSDAAFTIAIGDVKPFVFKLMDASREGVFASGKKVAPGHTIGDLSAAIQHEAESRGFSVVRHLYGHGVGASLHEDPAIFNYGVRGTGPKIVAGQVLAIETMVCEKGYLIETLDDGWTVVTMDGGLSTHFEDTFLVTKKGSENLTRVNIEGTPLPRG
jgi:methionyl aminopeptidase